MPRMSESTYIRSEEIVNCVVHGLGIAGSLVALPWLVLAAARADDPWLLVGALAFGLSALLMFSTSVLYHSTQDAVRRLRLRKVDHAAIYLLIAGTYTPFTLGAMKGTWGWTVAGIVWGLAVLGIAFKTTALGFRFPKASVALYLVMGWIVVIAAKPLAQQLTAHELRWLVAGGLCYTGGVLFYMWKGRPYTHAIWHVFVLAGVVCHFVAVLSVTAG
jgi:hemolysin III